MDNTVIESVFYCGKRMFTLHTADMRNLKSERHAFETMLFAKDTTNFNERLGDAVECIHTETLTDAVRAHNLLLEKWTNALDVASFTHDYSNLCKEVV